MYPDDVVTFFKSQAEAARALDVSDSAVGQWIRQGWMTYLRQCHIEKVTGGALTADKAHERPMEKAA